MKSNKIKTALLVFGITLFFSNSSFAQSDNRQEGKTPPTYSTLLEEMDANDDGMLSEKEVKGPLKKDFSKIDLDEDGFITEKEFEEAPKPKRGPKR